MKFSAYLAQTQAQQFMDLGLSTIKALDESSGLSTPATRIQRPSDGSHWSAPDHVFGEATDVGMSESR